MSKSPPDNGAGARGRLIFSVDVEDWPQSSFNRRLPIGDSCADNTRRILELMAGHGCRRATFFVLGRFAERHPQVVRQIHAADHEVASHGHGHEEVFRLTPSAFREDVTRATAVLSDIVGTRPRGYRAPDFSIVGESLWALDVLAECGYEYDSSIFPIAKARYGIPAWPTEPATVQLDNGMRIKEFPMTATTVLGRRVPIAGGGYARLLPGFLLGQLLAREIRQRAIPPVFYCHPYEIDAREFVRSRLAVPMKVRLHQGLGRRMAANKFAMLFRRFRCVSFDSILEEVASAPAIDYERYRLPPESTDRPGIFWMEAMGE
jgi:polysaccharide deacetylase family protein (PEP-CTERM system associated)